MLGRRDGVRTRGLRAARIVRAVPAVRDARNRFARQPRRIGARAFERATAARAKRDGAAGGPVQPPSEAFACAANAARCRVTSRDLA
ncbi:hypothetical protein WS72_06910 [Burkholderia savannae]|uniref:Uncharacterized protein n=1 Tax=Burkholderia savannae TaxID=1637837 RepID=A0ABR5TCQ4_9BURK|nr:hypothetical protein WS72_06910 [Burkholderia savannae]